MKRLIVYVASIVLLTLMVAVSGTALAASTTLVINEIDYDQPSIDTAEFLELKNVSGAPIELSGYVVELVNGTGGGASVYQTIDLPSFTLDTGDYYVICANTDTVVNCDLDVAPDTNLIQNGAPDAVALLFEGAIVDTVSYEGNTGAPYTEGSGAGLEDDASAGTSISRCPDGVDTDQNNVDFVHTDSTPGVENNCDTGGGGVEFGVCGDPATLIHDIQGSGDVSPLEDSEVVIEGIVVGDFQEGDGDEFNTDLDGFYVQEEADDFDLLDETSEGIFVFAPGAVDVNPGDVVRLAGEVDEFSGLTEITNVTQVEICGSTTLPEPVDLFLPADTSDAFERYEGMLVEFPEPLVISEYFNFDRFGEIVLAEPLEGEDRLYQSTAIHEPDSAEAATRALYNNELATIILDDARSEQNPDPARHPNGMEFTLDNRFRGGDLVQDLTGVLDYRFGAYRIQPTQGAEYISVNPRPEAPEEVGGSLQVASFNVLNYFLTLDNGPDICGPEQDQECRGADTQEEFERQRAKILSALAAIDADVFGLIEMENTTGVEPLQDIVEGLNDIVGSGTYDYIDTGTIGTDAIRVGIIYKTDTVTPVGDYAVLDDPAFTDPLNYGEEKSRPALAQTFVEDATGGVFTVVVNHLKSKGSACGEGDDDPEQGNCNLTRTLAAEVLVEWLATDPTGSGDPDVLIIGDLNAYDKEDPIDQIREGADDVLGTVDDYTDLIYLYEGEFAYTYVFDGQYGYLDYAMANQPLLPQVTGTTVWHINADEPDILDYDMSFKQDAQDALYEPNPYRSSDHDPVIVGLNLNGSPVCTSATPSLSSLWPVSHNFVSVDVLGVTDPEGDPITITIDSIFQDEAVDAPGSGNTAPDGQGVGTSTAEVRAERTGEGNGRVYYIGFTAVDLFGGSCTGEIQVGVPKSNSQSAVGDGPLFDSTATP